MLKKTNTAIVMALLVSGLASPALAQTCLTGMDLLNKLNQTFSDSDTTRAYSILHWYDHGASAVKINSNPTRSLLQCEGSNCGLDNGDISAFNAFKAYRTRVTSQPKGTPLPATPEAMNIPPAGMVAWAEKQLGCIAGTTYAERKNAQDKKSAAARAALEEARRLAPQRAAAAAAKAKADAAARAKAAAAAAKKQAAAKEEEKHWGSGPATNWNAPYTDSYTDKYGYDGPTTRQTAPPRSIDRRCYNQGNGKELCFYD